MGEAKRRAEQGLPPRANTPRSAAKSTLEGPGGERIVSWLPLSRRQADQVVQLTSRGAWVGIAALVLFWLTVRFIGPALGWWTLADG